ncbi:LysR family transcriptional regulator [Shimia biformata]|uniref:LysR family transcriptional regulator n=1 Tax=Shimia biformata TaxID=1294299 RepID=UPI00194EC436|nr:LysR family transcriptional regulator [Shimia biformata]
MKSDFDNWSDIRVFLAVMRTGSTLAASSELGIAQPTVARRIDALEHVLGLVLFERDTRGFRPTQNAHLLRDEAERMESAALSFAEKASTLRRPRPIRITAFAANLSGRSTDIFNDFSARHPEIEFEFLPGARVFDLMAGEADIALRLAWTQPDPELVCRKVSTAQFTMFCAASYAERHGFPASPQELKDHKILALRHDAITPRIYKWLRQQVPEERIYQKFSEASLRDAAVRTGQGVGLMNVRMAESDVKNGTLIRCFDPPEALNVPHLILISPDAYRRREVRTFVKFFAPRYAAIYK